MNKVVAGMVGTVAAVAAIASVAITPLMAQGTGSAIDIPEPSNLALLAIGVVGIIIGRRASRSRRRDDQGLDG